MATTSTQLEVLTLRQHRQRLLLSQRRLATKAGCSLATVFDLENSGKRPTFTTVGKLSEALGVEPYQVAEFRPVAGYED